jgi:hypothetical protein
MRTFVIDGTDSKSAFTTNLIPSFLLIILRGLSDLRTLKTFKFFKLDLAPEL